MVQVLMFPNLPAQAAALAATPSGKSTRILVHHRGTVIAPLAYRGMTIGRARELCHDAQICLRQPVYEQHAWENLLTQLWEYTPWIEPIRRGLVRCRGLDRHDLKLWLQQHQGVMGVARRTPVAVLAAVRIMHQNDGGQQLAVHPEDEEMFLDQLSVRLLDELSLPHLTPALYDRLELFGLGTIGRLCRLTEQQLRQQFGSSGASLWQFCRQLQDSWQDLPIELYRPAPSFSTRVSFAEGTREPAAIIHAAHTCIDQVLAALNPTSEQANLRVLRQMDLSVLDRTDAILSRQSRILAQATADRRRLHSQAAAMVHQTFQPHHMRGIRVWTVQIRIGMITTQAIEQIPLFTPRIPLAAIREPLTVRFPTAICAIDIRDPHAYLPEHFAHIRPL